MNVVSKIHQIRLLILSILFLFSVSGCSSDSGDIPAAKQTTAHSNAPSDPGKSSRDNTPQILTPTAPGTIVYVNEIVSIDISNGSEGYLTLIYSGSNEKVKFQIAAPDGVTYTYLVTDYSAPMVFPLTGGSGSYTFSLLEAADPAQDLYALAYTASADVAIRDEFLPFLTPNVYSDYTADSASVAKGMELSADCSGELEVIGQIYSYVIQNITYDDAKAQSVAYGYTPNPDNTLSSGTGICFDYASLMTAMLRSQRIPTRLEVGYAGEVYHAWISCYVEEIGWVDNIIEFDGKNWSLMDPTLAASNSSSAVQKYIGDGSSYVVKYTY